jgi:septum site-determining protein MinD
MRERATTVPVTGTLYVVAGGKGGCGKTTTTLGLARAAAGRHTATPPPDRPFDALAVDADVDMPNLHRLAGVEREPGLAAGPPAAVARQVADERRVGVIAAPTDGAVPPPALARCRTAAALSFVDCPAGAGRDAAVPLRVADAAVLVTTLSPACLRDTVRTAAMARAVGTPVAGIVVSRADRPPDDLPALFDAPTLAALPAVSAPLTAPAARSAYERTVATLASDET